MTSILFCFLASLLLLPALEAHSKALERITNGQEAKEGQFPYIVQLVILNNNSIDLSGCGGSIIANDWILTAAHCTEYAGKVIIFYGSDQYGQGQVKVEVHAHSIIQHPKYQWIGGTAFNDIALIRSKWVDFNDRIQKIALPKPNQRGESFAGQWSQSAGWGLLKDNSELISDRLQWVNLKIIENSVCRIFFYIDETHLCTETPDRKSVCGGDSGGPLVLDKEKILVGINSFVAKAGCEAGYPAGFTRVSKYLDWIRKVSNVTS
ncbi:serine protease 3-like [Drosophila tropicalis]|uniref:serine protease 3-like n=1 Tax=Drosophila tropicalis TaxID=46794 RepID=UPI0035AC087C